MEKPVQQHHISISCTFRNKKLDESDQGLDFCRKNPQITKLSLLDEVNLLKTLKNESYTGLRVSSPPRAEGPTTVHFVVIRIIQDKIALFVKFLTMKTLETSLKSNFDICHW